MMYLSKGGRATLQRAQFSICPCISCPSSPREYCKPYGEDSTRFLKGWARQRVQISLGKLVQGYSPVFGGGLWV